MLKYLSIACLLLFLTGCASDGPRFIDLNYLGAGVPAKTGRVGLAKFVDKRKDVDPGYVGKRIIGKAGTEVYYVNGLDLGGSVTRTCMSYLMGSGFACTTIPSWPHSPQGVRNASPGFTYVVTGEIRKMECFAVRKTGFTSMTLEIDMVVYWGDASTGTLHENPIKVTLERNEFSFSEEKLARFYNETLSEMLNQALSFK